MSVFVGQGKIAVRIGFRSDPIDRTKRRLYGPIQEMARASEKCWLNTPTTTILQLRLLSLQVRSFLKRSDSYFFFNNFLYSR